MPPRELTLIVGWTTGAGGALGMVLRKGDDGILAEGVNCSMWCWRAFCICHDANRDPPLLMFGLINCTENNEKTSCIQTVAARRYSYVSNLGKNRS